MILLGIFIPILLFWIFGTRQALEYETVGRIEFSTEESEWIRKNPVISVGVDPDFIPIEYLDSDNNYIGVAADFLSIIQKQTGLVFEIDKEHAWKESFHRVKTGKVHMVGAAVSSEQRKEFLFFSEPYVALSGVIIVREDVREQMSLEKLKGMSVTVVSNYIWEDILETSYPEVDLSPAPNIETALKKVSFGISDAMVGYLATASHHIERLGISNLKISGNNISALDISFAVNKEYPHLHTVLNKALAQIPVAKSKSIVKEWISLEFNPSLDLKAFTKVFLPWASFIILFIIGIIIWNRSLQRKVTQRTEKLNRELVQRNRVEKALRESEEKYRSIFGNIQDVYYETLPDGRILEISPSIEKVLGYSRQKMIRQSLAGIFVNQTDYQDMIEKVFRENRLADHETLLRQPNGNPINCSIHAVMIRNSRGDSIKIIGSIRNISNRVKARKALKKAYHELEKRVEERTAELRRTNRQLNRAKEVADAATLAKSHFLANMSHEIRTPLNGVISATELVMTRPLPEEVKRYIRIIENSGHALLGVIDDILDFSKIEAGKLEIETRPFHMEELLSRTYDLFKERMSKKNLTYRLDIAPGTPLYLTGDSFRLQQILTNLLGNAVKFTDASGEIRLEISGDQKDGKKDRIEMMFRVTDTGIGISPEHQNLLFTPFSQVDASTTRKHGGSGLGLSICGQLVEMMDGTITVESSPDWGSRFIFTIPLGIWENPDPEQRFWPSLMGPSHTITACRSYLEGKRVLVAEDTPTNQDIILAVLELASMKTCLVDTGVKAVEAVRNQAFDAVLMDIQMPEMDGFEATRAIRSLKSRRELPIIAMTAHTLKEDKAKCLAAGMNAYISKPVGQDKLFKTLISLIHDKQSGSTGHDAGPESKDIEYPPPLKTEAYRSVHPPKKLPGIEVEATMRNLGVDLPVFIKILKNFFKTHESVISRIETAWAGNDRDEVVSLLHGLKGSVSGIGAVELQEYAGKLERLCLKKKQLPRAETAGMPVLQEALNVVLTSIEKMVCPESGETEKSMEKSVDRVPSKAVLNRLEKSLVFPEIGEIDALMNELESVSHHPLLDELRSHIASYDYDLAQKTVIALKSVTEELRS